MDSQKEVGRPGQELTGHKDHYADKAARLAAEYDAIDPEAIHGWIRPHLGQGALDVLDVGAGSGRDAAWFSSMGHRVLAVEPSAAMREQGNGLHDGLRWVDDSLPLLLKTAELGHAFDHIHLSAVWMHVMPGERSKAFANIVSLARPSATLAFLVRVPHDPEREMHPTDPKEIPSLAKGNGLKLLHESTAKDHKGRAGIIWMRFVAMMPKENSKVVGK